MARFLSSAASVAAFVMAFSLAACGQKAQSSAPVDTTLSASSAPASSSVAASPSSDPASASPVATTPEAANAAADPNAAAYSADYNACMAAGDAAQGVTSAMQDCTNAEIDRQDQTLNATYKRVMAAAADDGERAQLRDAERKWIKARDATCTSTAADEGGGSMATVAYSDCELSQRIARIKQLDQH